MRKTFNIFILSFLTLAILVPSGALANLGVGVGTGKIELDEPVKPGGLYTLPPLTVINTGDEASDYGVSVEYKSDQPKMSPPKDWFIFTPTDFYLEPGQSQIVRVQVNIPIKATPGEYFAYLEGHPARKDSSAGGATVGIGAAAKLLFAVAPANIFQGIYYRVLFLLTTNAPWSYVILTLIAFSVLIVFIRKHFSFNIGVKKKSSE